MIGTILNVAGILIGGIAGLTNKTALSAANQNVIRNVLGACTVFCGLWLAWISLHGPFLQMLKQLAILLGALLLGKLAGRLLHLQRASNHLGQFARRRIESAKRDDPNRFTSGFLTCSALFCAAPLGILGAVQDGLSECYWPLAIKAAMDGLATMGFVSMFGWGAMVSAAPVLVFQGTVTLLCARFLQPVLGAAAVDSINATGGFLIVCIALIILEMRKIEVTDYLPALVVAPLLTRWLG